jgi:hypothetical protein
LTITDQIEVEEDDVDTEEESEDNALLNSQTIEAEFDLTS